MKHFRCQSSFSKLCALPVMCLFSVTVTSTPSLAGDTARFAGGDLGVDGIHFSADGSVVRKLSDLTSPWSISNLNISFIGGNVGIGTLTPAQKLSVGGVIESTAGGFKFPDGSIQTAAGISLTSPDSSLTLGGTPSAPTAQVNLARTGALYAPISGSTQYLSKSGDTMTGALSLPANGLQMSGNQMVTSGGSFGYGAAPAAGAYFDIAGSYTAPQYNGSLLLIDGTLKSNGSYAQAYLRGINVVPTFDLTAGYANFLFGINTNVNLKTGGNVAHSVVGYNMDGQPASGLECNVAFGIGVPNQQTSLCNGRYGFYQGDPNTQYNYFASNVGIGTPFPSQALTVQGNVQVSGTVSAGNIVGGASQALSFNSAAGQPVNILAAQGTGSGGAVTIAAGSAGINGGGGGGNLNLSAGNAMAVGGTGYANLGPAGNVSISAGSGYNSTGGNVLLTSGGNSPWNLTPNSFSKVTLQGGIINTGDGATLDVEGGHNTLYASPPQYSAGGNIKLTGGNATGNYSGGNIVLQPGTGSSAGTVQVNGDLNLSGKLVPSGGNLGYGAAPNAAAYFDIAGSFTAPQYNASLLQLDGTLKSNGSYAQAYLRGLNITPTFDLTAGYANFLFGINTNVNLKTGGNVAHSVVGYNMDGQPASGLECSVGFGIGVPNQQTSLCNGRYGFYQGDPTTQYNYFASNVGIGTPFPAQALTVQGNALVSGNISAGGTGTMPVYSNSGTAVLAPHMVTGTAIITGSNVAVALSGNASFTSLASYTCTATMQGSAPTAVSVQNTSGSAFTLYGSAGTVNYLCAGS